MATITYNTSYLLLSFATNDNRMVSPECNISQLNDIITINDKYLNNPIQLIYTDVSGETSALGLFNKLLIWKSTTASIINTTNLEKTIANSEMPLSPNYTSPYDYTVTYKTATTLDCIPLNGSPDVDSGIVNVVSLVVTRADGSVVKFLHGNLAEDGINKVALSAVGNVISILNGGTTPFLNTDIKYRLGVNYQQKSYDPISDAIKAFITNYPIQPLHTVLIPPSTSVIADSWFPSKDGIDVSIYKTHTFTGILAPATSQVLTIIVEGTNADDLTVDANWTAINFFNVASLSTVKSLATSAGTSTSFNIKITDCGYRNIRFRLTPTVNTNANTCNAYLNSIY